MHVEKIRLTNYSSFVDTNWIELSPRLNVVIGQNNSGKSAFLAAVGPNLPNRPHRDTNRYLPGDLKPALAELELKTTTSELRGRLSETGMQVRATAGGPSVAHTNAVKALLEDEREIVLHSKCVGGQSLTFARDTFRPFLQFDQEYIVNIQMVNGEIVVGNVGGGVEDNIANLFYGNEDPRFFQFIAQRLNIATYQFAAEKRLSSNAANLPAVLAYLSGNRPEVFDEIEERVKEVLPGIGALTVSPEDGNFKIILWPQGETRIRALAFDLDHSGTGVAQVIAIMAAVITSGPSVICIDEINSYLHPYAVKKLLQICTTFYPQHQYVVSSHSADVITFHDVDRMFLIEKDGFESSIRTINRSNLADVRLAFRELGISMADVLGSDRVVWVEGPTEELVFPELLKRHGTLLPEGTTFAAVAATGDFTRRGSSRKAVIDLYRAATEAVAPLAQASRFILDRETLSDDAVNQIILQTDGHLSLLPRRCIECFGIDPDAIAAVLNGELAGVVVTAAQVRDEIRSLAPDHQYGGVSRWTDDLSNIEWLKRVDGAKLIAAVFRSLSANHVAFEKTTHTPRILALVPMDNLEELVVVISNSLAQLAA